MWIIDQENPLPEHPLRRNAVSVYNFCTNQYDGIYSHEYRLIEESNCGQLDDDGIPDNGDVDGTVENCGGWAGVAERFPDDSTKPPVTVKWGFHHQQLEYDGQVSTLGPEVTTFIDPSVIDPEHPEWPLWQLSYLNPNSTWEAGTFQDDDGDDIPNSSDPDIDNDGAPNGIEQPCGATIPFATPPQLPEWNPHRKPERIDGVFAGTDDDGDTLVDDPLPSSADQIDCDLDGFVGNVERYVFSRSTTEDDQAACGETVTPPNDEDDDRWPADFDDNRNINISDVLALKPWIGTFVPPTSRRYDIVPSGSINISDTLALKAVFGRVCSTPPAGG